MAAYKGPPSEELGGYQQNHNYFRASRQQLPAISDPTKQELLGELVRQSLLGEQVATTEFHLFSARSASLGQVLKPRVLRANNAFLTKSSKYFSDLFGPDRRPSDASLVYLTDVNDVPGNAQIDDHGYGSDTDLDEYDDGGPENGSESVGYSESVGSAKSSRTSVSDDETKLPERKETAVQKVVGDKRSVNLPAIRHIVVKDSAFRTWYTLLNYLYTDKISFLPLTSTTPGGRQKSPTSFLDEPRCSAKSMYRLASKIGLDHLRDVALVHIRSQITEDNIVHELSCSLVSSYPQLLEMALDMLHSHMKSPSVVAGFPVLAHRIANKEIPHGADIIIGIQKRFLGKPDNDKMGSKRRRCIEE